MIGSALKVAAFFATTAVAIPYTTALLCNLAYGWPRIHHRYRRAFSPRKVYSLNLAVIQQMILVIRFLPLYIQFRTYYKNASVSEILKDTTYGRNRQKLDLYFPNQKGSWVEQKGLPVVVFVYGGAWGSGSKKMYGMVCSSIANRLGAIVCCPDYSTYPKGHVDNMVDDLVDCVTWLYQNIEQYDGDKSSILMLGHSSGAHLCFMSLYRFVESFQTHTQQASTTPPLTASSSQGKPFEFQDGHFDGLSPGSSDSGDGFGNVTSGSFYIVDGPKASGDGAGKQSSCDDTRGEFQFLSSQKSETELSEESLLDDDIAELMQINDSNLRYRGPQKQLLDHSEQFQKQDGEKLKSGSREFPDRDEDSGDDESVVTVVQSDVDIEGLDPTDLALIGQSVKAVIGLAGVYHIADHFQHESKRGVEDISSMGKAMYGPDQFDRFSPSHVYANVRQPIRLPKIVLIHGTDDHVVPLTSSTKFGEVLQNYHSDLVVRIIPNCDHYEICLDLNKPSRKYHQTVMAVIEDTAKSTCPR